MYHYRKMDLRLTKRFDSKRCRSCGGRLTIRRICLDCNEPSATWCENCLEIEEYIHAGHSELDLF
jgi:hypothetical protein